MQPTDHDRTCFVATKEEIPIAATTLAALLQLYRHCAAVDRMEALRTVESMVFRAAEGQLNREALWKHRRDDLASYKARGGVVGLDMDDVAVVDALFELTKVHLVDSGRAISDKTCV